MSDIEGKVTRVGARERGVANEFQIVEAARKESSRNAGKGAAGLSR